MRSSILPSLFQLCGFDATKPYWYRRPSHHRISTSHVLRLSRSEMPHAYRWDPCPWNGLLILLAVSIRPDPRFLLMLSATNNQRGALSASTRSRWRQDALQAPPQILQCTTGWDGCGPFLSEGLRCITWNTRGLVGSVFSSQRNREFKLKYLKRLLDINNIICLQEVHGKDECLQAIQVLAPRFRLFGTFLRHNECGGIGYLHSQGPSASQPRYC